MYDWVLYVLSWFAALVSPPAPPQVQYVEALPQDYVGVVAVEAAYTTLLPKSVKPAPKPIDPANCPTCKGTGRVRTGDGQHWTKCPTCDGGTGDAPAVNATTAFSEKCDDGTCPAPKPQVSSSAPAKVVQPYTRRQVTNAN